LGLLGIQFEDLFDETKLPGKADKTADTGDSSIENNDGRETRKILQEINSKLDKVIFQQKGDRIRKSYSQRFFDLHFYLESVKNTIVGLCGDPVKNGFSFKKMRVMKQNVLHKKYMAMIFIFFSSPCRIYIENRISKNCFPICRITLMMTLE
jgi:hypothetical protein